jgi:hypothetical protein
VIVTTLETKVLICVWCVLKIVNDCLPKVDCAGGRGGSDDPRMYIDCICKESSNKTNEYNNNILVEW